MRLIPENRIPTHPGEILLEEFLKPMGMTQVAFASHLGIYLQRLNEIVRGKRGVTAETTGLFSESLDTTPEFWMNMQIGYDLARNRITRQVAPLHAPAD